MSQKYQLINKFPIFNIKNKKTPDSDILFKKIIVPLHTLNHEDTLLQN